MPSIIDESLFESLHTWSVRRFDLLTEGIYEDNIQRVSEGTVQISDKSAGEIDWKAVLKGREYVEVKVCGGGEYTEYGDKWDYKRLRVDYKHRMEFVLNYEKCGMEGYGDEIREAMNESRL